MHVRWAPSSGTLKASNTVHVTVLTLIAACTIIDQGLFLIGTARYPSGSQTTQEIAPLGPDSVTWHLHLLQCRSKHMLKFLHSMFHHPSGAGYPESILKAAIERAVESTDPWIRAVPGYRAKLRPAVTATIDYVVSRVDRMPPPQVLDSGSFESDPRLRVFFGSRAELGNLLQNDPELAEFLHREPGVPRIFSLLVMEKDEKVFLGAELAGEVVVRDVPQTSVTFRDFRLLDPTGSEEQTRRLLKRRAFDHLLSLALRRIAVVKEARGELERDRALLQAKIDLLQQGGWGFHRGGSGKKLEVEEIEATLSQIDGELFKLGGDDRMLELYLDIVTDVLGHPEQHMWLDQETLIVDRMGIKRKEASSDAPEVTVDVMGNDQGSRLVVSLLSVSAEMVRQQ